tara:strand:+ start:18588 stop:19145 length:558 start_codon:yes stop_codon:yes gene_type:complete
MISKIGGHSTFVSSEQHFRDISKIILPGVGHFDEGMRSLNKSGLIQPLLNSVKSGMPLLGICLGMQLLCRSSDEGIESGLGLIDADVKKFHFPKEKNLKVPHMGWNIVDASRTNALLPSYQRNLRFYFVHSYHVVLDSPQLEIGVSNYGYDFCAAFQKGQIFGVQFHPEKSHKFGMALMKRFWEL